MLTAIVCGLSSGADPRTCEQQEMGFVAISSTPRVLLFPAFLSPLECDALIMIATNRTTNSLTYPGVSLDASTSTQAKAPDPTSRSSTTFVLQPHLDKLRAYFQPLHDRISCAVGIPNSHAEHLQVQHYEPGASYTLHLDHLPEKTAAPGDNRVATFLMFLNDVPEGGETVFPSSSSSSSSFTNAIHSQQELLQQVCSSSSPKALKVRPRKGTALLFFPTRKDGSANKRALHGSCPTTTTEKWVAQRWFHRMQQQ